jgi:hypothetical protein
MTTADTASEILDLLQQWADAEANNDADRLDLLLADVFAGVGPAGFVLDREQWLGRFRGGLENRAFSVQEPQVHDHASAVVVVGSLVQQTSFQRRDNSGRFRVTLTAVRPAERWQIASIHIGPLQTPPTGS